MGKEKLLSILLLFLINTGCLYAAKKVITIGGAQKDFYIRPKGSTTTNNTSKKKKIEIQNPDTYTSTGGGAVNVAISFRRLGFVVTTFLKMGNDEGCKFFLKKLEAEGINTDNIIYTDNSGTGISYIIPSGDTDNTILVYRGSNEYLKPEELPIKSIQGSDIVYITSLGGESKSILLPAIHAAKKANAVVAINPGIRQIKKDSITLKNALPYIDILMLNNSETKQLIYELVKLNPELQQILDKEKTGDLKNQNLPELLCQQMTYEGVTFKLTQFFKIILDIGPKVAVVTNGAEGVYVATKQNVYFLPSLPVNVVNTTGAGDAFNSCFVATLLKNSTLAGAVENGGIEKAIVFGTINGASVVSFMDTNKGLLNQDELAIKASYLEKDLLQKFPLE